MRERREARDLDGDPLRVPLAAHQKLQLATQRCVHRERVLERGVVEVQDAVGARRRHQLRPAQLRAEVDRDEPLGRALDGPVHCAQQRLRRGLAKPSEPRDERLLAGLERLLARPHGRLLGHERGIGLERAPQLLLQLRQLVTALEHQDAREGQRWGGGPPSAGLQQRRLVVRDEGVGQLRGVRDQEAPPPGVVGVERAVLADERLLRCGERRAIGLGRGRNKEESRGGAGVRDGGREGSHGTSTISSELQRMDSNASSRRRASTRGRKCL